MAEREATGPDVLDRVATAIAARLAADPATSYVAALVAKGDDAILKKIGEEATETVRFVRPTRCSAVPKARALRN